MLDNALYLVIVWNSPPLATLGHFADDVAAFLRKVQAANPIFRNLHLVGRSKADSPALAADMSNLEPWIRLRGWNEHAPTNTPYSERQPDGSLSRDSRGELGFEVALANLQPAGRNLRLDFSGGTHLARGGMTITLPTPPAGEFTSANFIKQLFADAQQALPVKHAFTTSYEWNLRVNTGPGAPDRIAIGGITYCPHGSVAQAMPQGVEWELWNRGVLIKLTERPDLMSESAVAAAIEVRNALEASNTPF